MAEEKTPAGGRATFSGTDFQSRVGAWFAAHLLAARPIGQRFGISVEAFPASLRFETGAGLDDVVTDLSDGGAVYVQCKSNLSLETASKSPLGRTIAQLVHQFYTPGVPEAGRDPRKYAGVLAYGKGSSASLQALEQGCRMLDHGGTRKNIAEKGSDKVREAMAVFDDHVRSTFSGLHKRDPTDEELTQLARLFHVIEYSVDDAGSDWATACSALGQGLFGDAVAGGRPMGDLLVEVTRLTKSGATATREGLTAALRAKGHIDTRAPRYEEDIRRLTEASAAELDRLRRHSKLVIDGGVPVPRECLPLLADAVDRGSLLVVGDPGVGKTGVLVELADKVQAAGQPLVTLSVEQLSGMAVRQDLERTLGLSNPLETCLEAWPGVARGVLLIDALDAARGGPAEGILATLIEDAIARVGERWSVVASIRTFDLRNGRRYRQAMKGTPPSAAHQEPGVEGVRHFKIPELLPAELVVVANKSPRLEQLLSAAPDRLKALLLNIFNLSLAADLIDQGATPEDFRELTTQSALIDRYEDERLPEHPQQLATKAVIEEMLKQKRLAVRATDVGHDRLGDVVQAGVLARVADRVSFAHHVLFDHAAARFVLHWDDVDEFAKQVGASSILGLMLSPSIRFAVDRIWQGRERGPAFAWRLVRRLVGDNSVDAVVSSAVVRTVVSLVRVPADVEGIGQLVEHSSDPEGDANFLASVARFVRMRILDGGGLTDDQRRAWVAVAKCAISVKLPLAAEASRLVMRALSEEAAKTSKALPEDFGDCARALLTHAWSMGDSARQLLIGDAISLVAKSFSSSPSESRALLEQILVQPRFDAHAHYEGRELAQSLDPIVAVDPEFAVRIYAAFFLRDMTRDEPTFLGGQPSQILPLMTNVKQDYKMVRWQLAKKLPRFLERNPEYGTRAVNAALAGLADIEPRPEKPEVDVALLDRVLHVVEDGQTYQDWRSRRGQSGSEESVLPPFVDFLRKCTPEAFRIAVDTTRAVTSATSVWARVFGVACEGKHSADDLLWPCATAWELLTLSSSMRDAIGYVATAYPRRRIEDRQQFEQSLLHRLSVDEQAAGVVVKRWVSIVPPESIATDEMRARRRDLESAKELSSNPPLMTITTSFRGNSDDVTQGMLEASGVNLEVAADRAIFEATKELRKVYDATDKKPTREAIAALWTALAKQLEVVDAHPSANPESLRAGLGIASNALERIVQADAFAPGSNGHPSLDVVVTLAERFIANRFPEPSTEGDDSVMGWGNWDIRVYGAACVMALAVRSEAEALKVRGLLKRLLDDPVPTVRLQVAQALNTLWDVARPAMWDLAEHVAQNETNVGVLGFFVGGPLTAFSWHEPERAERLLSTVLSRSISPAGNSASRRQLDESVAHVLLVQWLAKGRAGAQTSIRNLLSNLVGNDELLWHVISGLRETLFAAYGNESKEAEQAQHRARELLEEIVAAAAAATTSAQEALKKDQSKTTVEDAQALFAAGEKLMSHACDQLYFGAGAFNQQSDEPKGLASPEAMRRFLTEYQGVLRVLGTTGRARTLHNLIELYTYLADAAPGPVFDELARVLDGPSAETGFQYESLAVESVVGLVRRYLADHRDVFDEQAQRERLLRVLGVFARVGWPEAIALLYDLPDLLR